MPDECRRIAVNGDFTPFCISVDGTPHLVLAGTGSAIERHVHVDAGDGVEPYPIHNGVWMTFPAPFAAGTRVTVVWQDEHGAVTKRVYSHLRGEDTLAPVFGDSWTGYA